MTREVRVKVSFELTREEAGALERILHQVDWDAEGEAVLRRDAKRKLRVALARGLCRYDTRHGS